MALILGKCVHGPAMFTAVDRVPQGDLQIVGQGQPFPGDIPTLH
jgi:hypothetical protein